MGAVEGLGELLRVLWLLNIQSKAGIIRIEVTPFRNTQSPKAHEKDGVMVSKARLDQVSSGKAEPSSGLLLASVLVGFPRGGIAGQPLSKLLLPSSFFPGEARNLREVKESIPDALV